MTVTNWNQVVIDGKNFIAIDVAKFLIPLDWDPSSNMFIAVAAPNGGLGNFPALVKGDDGDTPDIDLDIDFTPIPYGDATAEFASWTETSPNVYKLNLGLRSGQKGDDGDSILDPTDYGTPVAGRLLRVKSDLSGFELFAPPVGDRYIPASVTSVPTGNPAYTMCHINIDAQPFDCRVEIEGQTVVTGTSSDVRVDLIARLDDGTGLSNRETAGPIVGRGFGLVGIGPSVPHFTPGPPAGSSGTYDKVLAGNTSIVYVRTERQAGSGTYSTDDDTSYFRARVFPIP